jgi:hypothetical protein
MANPVYFDTELVAELVRRKGGGRSPISVSTLRKDRLGAQRIPFHRLTDGGRCLYDVEEVLGVISGARFGGVKNRRTA